MTVNNPRTYALTLSAIRILKAGDTLPLDLVAKLADAGVDVEKLERRYSA